MCDVVLTYTSTDFENWAVGLGTILIGVGTLGIAYGAVKTIPDKISASHKDPELIKLYQKVVYRDFGDSLLNSSNHF